MPRKHSDEPKFPASRAWVRDILEKRKWKQKELAEAVGVGHELVRKWASGSNRPGYENTLKLSALASGHDAADAVDSFPMAPMEQVLIEHFRLLSAEQKEEVFNRVLSEATKRSQARAAHEPKS